MSSKTFASPDCIPTKPSREGVWWAPYPIKSHSLEQTFFFFLTFYLVLGYSWLTGFPGSSAGKESAYNAGCRFDSRVRKILWRRQWFSAVQISSSVVSNSLRPRESQHARPPCPSPTPGVHSDSRPSSQWCHPAISSSIVPFSSCPQSLPASESFPMSQLIARGGQSTGVSKEIPGLISFRMDWLDLLAVQGTSSPTPQFKSINFSALSLLHSPTLTSIHDHRKNHSLD